MRKEPLVSNIQKFSVRDGPGIRSVVFFKGCPLSCEWCANPENIGFEKEIMFHQVKCIGCGFCVKACERGALTADPEGLTYAKAECSLCGRCVKRCPARAREMKGEEKTVRQIIEEIDQDISFYKTSGGGVTFSGGEPLLWPAFVREIAEDYKGKHLSTAVETCGCVPWENIDAVRDVIDTFLYDVKMIDEADHIRWCGGSNKVILENLEKLLAAGANVTVRVPIIPGVNDTEKNLDQTGTFLAGLGEKIKTVHILPYHNFGISKYEDLGKEYKLMHVEVPDEERMNDIRSTLESHGLTVQIGG